MKKLQWYILMFLYSVTLQASLEKELILLQRALRILSTQLASTVPVVSNSNSSQSNKGLLPEGDPVSAKELENWLLRCIELYKQDPLIFTQKISAFELGTLKSRLILYVNKTVNDAETADEDISIDPAILNFIGIPLREKPVVGADNQFKVLSRNITENDYDNTKKYAHDYIDAITLADFSKQINAVNQEIELLAGVHNTLVATYSQEPISDLATLYVKMRSALHALKKLMMPVQGQAVLVQAGLVAIKKRFENDMVLGQKILMKSYKQFQKDPEILRIETQYQEHKAKIELKLSQLRPTQVQQLNEQLDALKINRAQDIKKRINTLLYARNDIHKMAQACKDVELIADTTAGDSEKLFVSHEISQLCINIQSVLRIHADAQALDHGSQDTKKHVEQAYNNVLRFQAYIQAHLETIPHELIEKLKQLQAALAIKLENFIQTYQEQIRSKAEAIISAHASMNPSPNAMNIVNDVAQSCLFLKVIYTQKNEEAPEPFKGLCKLTEEILKR